MEARGMRIKPFPIDTVNMGPIGRARVRIFSKIFQKKFQQKNPLTLLNLVCRVMPNFAIFSDRRERTHDLLTAFYKKTTKI